jgi:gliding motility-associated-like protein
MEGKDPIKDLFSEKLSQLEVPVRTEIWSAVSSQISVAAPAAVGLSVVSKIIIGVSVAASVSVGVYLISKNKEEVKDQKRTAQQSVQVEKTTNETTLKKKETSEKPFVFDKILELPSDVDYESTEEIESMDNLDTHALKDGSFDFVTEKENTPEPIPAENPSKGETLVNDNEQIDSKTDESTENVLIEESKYEVLMVNTFTPNNDGVNDELLLDIKGLSDFNLVVLDRNNKVVYQTNDPNFRWNGVGMNNEMVQAGKYVYYITAKDSNGKSVSKYSPLEIIR